MLHRVQSNVVLKSELGDVLRSQLATNEALPPDSQARIAYNLGFRKAIEAVATTYGLTIPDAPASTSVGRHQHQNVLSSG